MPQAPEPRLGTLGWRSRHHKDPGVGDLPRRRPREPTVGQSTNQAEATAEEPAMARTTILRMAPAAVCSGSNLAAARSPHRRPLRQRRSQGKRTRVRPPLRPAPVGVVPGPQTTRTGPKPHLPPRKRLPDKLAHEAISWPRLRSKVDRIRPVNPSSGRVGRFVQFATATTLLPDPPHAKRRLRRDHKIAHKESLPPAGISTKKPVKPDPRHGQDAATLPGGQEIRNSKSETDPNDRKRRLKTPDRTFCTFGLGAFDFFQISDFEFAATASTSRAKFR
jgi:hypothetical protein